MKLCCCCCSKINLSGYLARLPLYLSKKYVHTCRIPLVWGRKILRWIRTCKNKHIIFSSYRNSDTVPKAGHACANVSTVTLFGSRICVLQRKPVSLDDSLEQNFVDNDPKRILDALGEDTCLFLPNGA